MADEKLRMAQEALKEIEARRAANPDTYTAAARRAPQNMPLQKDVREATSESIKRNATPEIVKRLQDYDPDRGKDEASPALRKKLGKALMILGGGDKFGLASDDDIKTTEERKRDRIIKQEENFQAEVDRLAAAENALVTLRDLYPEYGLTSQQRASFQQVEAPGYAPDVEPWAPDEGYGYTPPQRGSFQRPAPASRVHPGPGAGLGPEWQETGTVDVDLSPPQQPRYVPAPTAPPRPRMPRMPKIGW